MNNHGARADHCRPSLISTPEQDDRPYPDVRERMHRHASAQQDPWRKMHVIADSAVVLHNGGGVYNAILPDPSVPALITAFAITTVPSSIRADFRYHCGGMEQSGGQQPVTVSPLKACRPDFVFPDGDQKLSGAFALE